MMFFFYYSEVPKPVLVEQPKPVLEPVQQITAPVPFLSWCMLQRTRNSITWHFTRFRWLLKQPRFITAEKVLPTVSKQIKSL